jgi:hypothetical protein
VTALPLCETAAFQPWETASPPANDHSSCHEEIASPVLVMFTAAVNPLFH